MRTADEIFKLEDDLLKTKEMLDAFIKKLHEIPELDISGYIEGLDNWIIMAEQNYEIMGNLFIIAGSYRTHVETEYEKQVSKTLHELLSEKGFKATASSIANKLVDKSALLNAKRIEREFEVQRSSCYEKLLVLKKLKIGPMP